MVHLNLTAPGNVVCSVYAPTIKPAFTERHVKHAGHARACTSRDCRRTLRTRWSAR